MIELLTAWAAPIVGAASAVYTYFYRRSLTHRMETNHAELLELIRSMIGRPVEQQREIAEQARCLVATGTLTGGLKGSIVGVASLGTQPKKRGSLT